MWNQLVCLLQPRGQAHSGRMDVITSVHVGEKIVVHLLFAVRSEYLLD